MEHVIVEYILDRSDDESAAKRQQTVNMHRAVRDLSNPFNDPNFQAVYTLTPDLALSLIDTLRMYYPASCNSNAIPVETKFLSALYFYAQGSYQKPGGEEGAISLSQASVSKAISHTTNALNKPEVLCRWIRFPCETEERQCTIQKNYRNLRLPGVVGCVDCTHVIIKKPATNEDQFRNGKGQHSINYQVVCDSDLLLLNILARYPGSTHDSFVWRASAVRDRMMDISRTTPCWLLGDSSYPLEPWLLTPVLNAVENSPEARYTQLHLKAHNCAKRCIGLMTERFKCLNSKLEYAPTKAGYIINACAVLHNYCIKSGLEPLDDNMEVDDTPIEYNIECDEPPQIDSDVENRGQQVRTDLINRLFN